MNKPRAIPIPKWLPDLVAKHEITEQEAAAMMKWAFEQVDIAAAIYAIASQARRK